MRRCGFFIRNDCYPGMHGEFARNGQTRTLKSGTNELQLKQTLLSYCPMLSFIFSGRPLVGFILFLTGYSGVAQRDAPYLQQRNDTIMLQNSLISRQFLWNNGHLTTVGLTNKQSEQHWRMQKPSPDFSPNLALEVISAQWDTATVAANSITPRHFRWQVVTDYGDFSLKRIYRVYDSVAMIGLECYVKGRLPQLEAPSTDTKATGVENAPTSMSRMLVPDHLTMPGRHWKLTTVRFQDVTDHYNTLVQTDQNLLYRKELLLPGNLLFAQDRIGGGQVVWLKESPLGNHQLAYPGHDFRIQYDDWSLAGLGIESNQASEEWMRGYGAALGVTGDGEQERLVLLRKYLKHQRRHLPERDEMIMMNTWGDRGQDGRLREAFALAELEAAHRLGVTHLQLDDGWQAGLSKNSASASGELWDAWPKESWQPHPERFPNGLTPVVKKASALDMKLGLWFHPSNANEYQQWQQDAEVVLSLHQTYGINYFKIDGIELPTLTAQRHLRHFFDTVQQVSRGRVVFNLDATAGRRGGYFFFNEYGNIFLENRYTDWTNYYPYQTLRNLWMLSRYVPPEDLQIEFLNKWRNPEKYPANDPFAPARYSFDYLFATAMTGQPLVWLEATNLPDEAFRTASLVRLYREHRAAFHRGVILPVGDEPSGRSWTGFQSISGPSEGYLLIFRENNDQARHDVATWLEPSAPVTLTDLRSGEQQQTQTDADGALPVMLTQPNSFAFFRYQISANPR